VLQGVSQGFSPDTVHKVVAEILKDRGYRRSVLGSVLGRIAIAIYNALNWLEQAAEKIPGGRTTVIAVITIVALLIVGRIVLASEWRNEGLIRRGHGTGKAGRFDPWSEAERLAASGDHTGAAHALYQAVLRRIAGSERIRLHSSKTSGDYWRELRRRGSPVAPAFRLFGRRFDRVIFGVGECSREEFEAMLREAYAVAERQAA
jgi:hypothetical protein